MAQASLLHLFEHTLAVLLEMTCFDLFSRTIFCCPATRPVCQAVVVALVAEPEMEPEQEPSGPDHDIEQAPGAQAFKHVYSVYRF